MDGRWARCDVWPMPTGVSSPLGKQGDGQWVLARALVAQASHLNAGRHINARGRDVQQRLAHIGGGETASQRDGNLAGNGRGQHRVHAGAGAAGMRPARGVQQDPLGASAQKRVSAIHDGRGRVAGTNAERLPDGTADSGDGRCGLVAVELDRVGINGRDDGGHVGRRQVDGDDDDPCRGSGVAG